MPLKLYEWLSRIKSVESEHNAGRLAINRLLTDAKLNSAILAREINVRDVLNASENLEGTYTVRLFAEFETCLREFWHSARATDPPSRARDLLDGIAATRRIPHDQLTNAHLVREYRNSLVHERDDPTEPIPIAESRGHLCRFMSFLPPEW